MWDWLKKGGTPQAPLLVHDLVHRTGWSQNQLALELGVSQPTISRWLSGKQQPNFEQTARIFGLLFNNAMDAQFGYHQFTAVSGTIGPNLEVKVHSDRHVDLMKFDHGLLSRWSISLQILEDAVTQIFPPGWIVVINRLGEEEVYDLKTYFLFVCKSRGPLIRQGLPGTLAGRWHLIAPGLEPILDADARRSGVVVGAISPSAVKFHKVSELGSYESAYFR